jgi:hypothetical protein
MILCKNDKIIKCLFTMVLCKTFKHNKPSVFQPEMNSDIDLCLSEHEKYLMYIAKTGNIICWYQNMIQKPYSSFRKKIFKKTPLPCPCPYLRNPYLCHGHLSHKWRHEAACTHAASSKLGDGGGCGGSQCITEQHGVMEPLFQQIWPCQPRECPLRTTPYTQCNYHGRIC